MTLHDTKEAALEFAKSIEGVWGMIQVRHTCVSPLQWLVIKQPPSSVEHLIKHGKVKIYKIEQAVCLRTPVAAPVPTKCDGCRRETGELKPVDGKTRFSGRTVDVVEHLCPGCCRMRNVMAQS